MLTAVKNLCSHIETEAKKPDFNPSLIISYATELLTLLGVKTFYINVAFPPANQPSVEVSDGGL